MATCTSLISTQNWTSRSMTTQRLIGTLYRKQRDTRNSSHMDVKSFQMNHVTHISTEMASLMSEHHFVTIGIHTSHQCKRKGISVYNSSEHRLEKRTKHIMSSHVTREDTPKTLDAQQHLCRSFLPLTSSTKASVNKTYMYHEYPAFSFFLCSLLQKSESHAHERKKSQHREEYVESM